MKLETPSNPSTQQGASEEDSMSDNFSIACNLEQENDFVKTQLRKEKIISNLEIKLADNEKCLRQKEAIINDKNDLIKSLKMSIDLMTQNKDLQNEITDLKNTVDLTKNINITKEEESPNNLSKDPQLDTQGIDKDQLQDLQTLKELNNEHKAQMVELGSKIKEIEDKLAKLEDKSAINDNLIKSQNNEIIFLNHSMPRNIKFVNTNGISPYTAVFEDIPNAGSGWMVIQRRFDGTVSFEKNDFQAGFGDINGEFWLGTNIIHEITTHRRHELYIELVDFDNVTAHARYDHFIVENKDKHFKLSSLGSYSGNAGDALRSHENYGFYKNYSSSWWRSAKPQCNLNGPYVASKEELPHIYCPIFWGNWYLGIQLFPIKACKMLIRPK